MKDHGSVNYDHLGESWMVNDLVMLLVVCQLSRDVMPWQTTNNITRSSTNQDNDQRIMTPTDNSQLTWLRWWLPLRLSKGQSMSPQTVLLRTTLTRMIIIILPTYIEHLFSSRQWNISQFSRTQEMGYNCNHLMCKIIVGNKSLK